MKVFTRDYRITGEYHPLWGEYFGDMKPCVLDIEATGLDRTRCKAVLIGLLMRTDSGVRITQFLAENHYEEAKVLEASMDYLEENRADYIITFNGYAYDVPFINARLDANMLGRHLRMYHFDLYRFLRKHTDLRSRVSSMSQMSIEDHYGILSDRGDTITGRESVSLFDQYAISGNSTIEKIILTHNREDVLHLHRLMYLSLADVPDLHKAISAYGFPAADGRLSVRHKIKRAGSGRTADPHALGKRRRTPQAGRRLRINHRLLCQDRRLPAPLPSDHAQRLHEQRSGDLRDGAPPRPGLSDGSRRALRQRRPGASDRCLRDPSGSQRVPPAESLRLRAFAGSGTEAAGLPEKRSRPRRYAGKRPEKVRCGYCAQRRGKGRGNTDARRHSRY